MIDFTGSFAQRILRLLSRAVEQSPSLVLITDAQGRVEYVNHAFTAVTGYTFEEVVGEEAANLSVQTGAEQQEIWETIVKEGEWRGEIRNLRKNGEVFWTRAVISPVKDEEGNITHFLGLGEEITLRKLAEEALEASEERYRYFYEDNPSMYFTVDGEGTVLSVNRFGADQLGYSVEELVGDSVLGVFHEEDREDVARQLRECQERPGEVVDWEFRKVRKDGSVMWVRELARAVNDAAGRRVTLIVCEDITQRRLAEEALERSRDELDRKVVRALERGNAYGLTLREIAALQLVTEGKSDKEIGAILGISPRTANKHLENILSKMGASSRTEAGVRAVREGLLD